MDFHEQLTRQLRFIDRSCKAYDAGETEEAVRIANAIFTIFNDGSGYKSLLSQLGVRKTLRLISTSLPIIGAEKLPFVTTMIIHRLTPVPLNEKVEARPNLGIKKCHYLPAPHWWSGEQILTFQAIPLCRRDFVTWARHTDGGAHVGNGLPPLYERMQSGHDMPAEAPPVKYLELITNEVKLRPRINLHMQGFNYAMIRQIAFEVLRSDLLGLLGNKRKKP